MELKNHLFSIFSDFSSIFQFTDGFTGHTMACSPSLLHQGASWFKQGSIFPSAASHFLAILSLISNTWTSQVHRYGTPEGSTIATVLISNSGQLPPTKKAHIEGSLILNVHWGLCSRRAYVIFNLLTWFNEHLVFLCEKFLVNCRIQR